MTIQCPRCARPCPADQKFCGECGAALRALPASPKLAAPGGYTPRHLAEQILTSREALEGERKQLTVLFADLKGSMEALADRDPEDARGLLDPVLTVMMEAVHHYEGTVNQVMGDGIMALFGAPVTHEDHAIRACYAALRMQEAFARHADGVREARDVQLQMRVGLNSGEVVVRSIGSDLRMDYSAVGLTTHLASRMEQLAAPGSILIAPATLALAQGFVRVQERGPVTVKGLAAPVEAYELLGATTAPSRFQVAAATRGLTRFVGRETELAELGRALEEAASGSGQVVAVVGEPGVGKSRLVWEFARAARAQGWLVVEGSAMSYEKAAVLLPVVHMLRAYFELGPRDDVATIRDKVTGRLLALGEAADSMLPPLLSLLEVPVPDERWLRLDPPTRRTLTIDAVRRLLLWASAERPLLLVCEDLHWIDGETQALLDALVESLPTSRVLLLVNSRPRYEQEWGRRSWYRLIRIDPLGPEGGQELLENLLGHDPGLGPLKRLLIERTGGNPFFLEECVRALVETRLLHGRRDQYRLARALERLEIPLTVQAILAARIDRLDGEDKRLLQAAAVIGHDVPYAIVEAIADQPSDDVRGGLARLQAAGFLDQTRLFPDLQFTFKHALTHEVAYEGLLHAKRRALHRRIVDAMERLHGERLDEHAERLAHHAVGGELWKEAVTWCRRAAARAASRSAYARAASHLEQALAALGHLAATRESTEQAVDIRLDLRELLVPLGEQRHNLDRLNEALPLAETLKDRRRLGRVYGALAVAHWLLGDAAHGVEYGEKALKAAEEIDDPLLRMRSQLVVGTAHHALGNFRDGARACEATIGLLRGDVARERFGMYPVYARTWLTFCLTQLGDFAHALEVAQESIELARANGRPEPLVASGAALGSVHHQRGNLAEAAEEFARGLELCREAGIGVWLPFMAGSLGHAYALAGRLDEALPLLDEGVADSVTQTRVDAAIRMVWLAEAQLLAGRGPQALSGATRALEVARDQHARGAEALVRLLLGQMALSAGLPDVVGARGHYDRAMALGEELGMRPLIAHCHAGLAKLCRGSGDQSAAGEHAAAATAMYREMGMTYWLEQTRRFVTSET